MLNTGTVTPDIEALPFKSIISFRSKKVSDTTLWTGTLIGRGVYESFRDDGSVQPYNEAVRQVDPSVPSDWTELSYFLIRIANNGTTRDALFAKEWILDGSLQVLTQSALQVVTVSDPYGDTNRLLNYIRSGGYSARLSS